MGWKAVKDHYRIVHLVHCQDGNLCIGSYYASVLIVVSPDGRQIRKLEGERMNADLRRYVAQISADPQAFQTLFAKQDVFERSIPVYTYEQGAVLEKFCEERGWPHVTHDGLLMYENTSFATREEAGEKGKAQSRAGIQMYSRMIADREKDLAKLRQELEQLNRDLAQYEAEFPTSDQEPV